MAGRQRSGSGRLATQKLVQLLRGESEKRIRQAALVDDTTAAARSADVHPEGPMPILCAVPSFDATGWHNQQHDLAPRPESTCAGRTAR